MSLRMQMPQSAAAVDWLRAAFGADVVDDAIRASLRGEPVFCAREGDLVIGTPIAPPSAPTSRGGLRIVGGAFRVGLDRSGNWLVEDL